MGRDGGTYERVGPGALEEDGHGGQLCSFLEGSHLAVVTCRAIFRHMRPREGIRLVQLSPPSPRRLTTGHGYCPTCCAHSSSAEATHYRLVASRTGSPTSLKMQTRSLQ